MRFIAFIAIALCLIWFNCFAFNIGDFWGVVCSALRFAVAFPLSWCSCAWYFRLCWFFGCSPVFLCWCVAFVRSVVKFKPLTVAVFCPSRLLVRPPCARWSVRAVHSFRPWPWEPTPPLCARDACVCGVTSPFPYKNYFQLKWYIVVGNKWRIIWRLG